jgi:hypothetical protein
MYGTWILFRAAGLSLSSVVELPVVYGVFLKTLHPLGNFSWGSCCAHQVGPWHPRLTEKPETWPLLWIVSQTEQSQGLTPVPGLIYSSSRTGRCLLLTACQRVSRNLSLFSSSVFWHPVCWAVTNGFFISGTIIHHKASDVSASGQNLLHTPFIQHVVGPFQAPQMTCFAILMLMKWCQNPLILSV